MIHFKSRLSKSNRFLSEKVILSDEPILDTLEKLYRTKKELCLPLQEDIDFITGLLTLDNLKKDTIEYLIYRKLTSQGQNPCCLYEYAHKMEQIARKDFFILHGKAIMAGLKILNPFVRKDIFIGDKPFISPLFVYYLSKSINQRAKAEFNRQVYIQMENGYILKGFEDMDQVFNREFPPVGNTFHSSQEYVQYYSLISDVTMNDFTFVYLFYGFWSLMMLICVLRCNIRHLRRLFRTSKRYLHMLIGSARSNLFNKVKTRIRQCLISIN